MLLKTSLLFAPDFLDKLGELHPALSFSNTRLALPSYYLRFPVYQSLKNGLFRTGLHAFTPLLKPWLSPQVLFLGAPFEPYEQSYYLQHKPPKLNAKEINACLVMLPNIDTSLENLLKPWLAAGFKIAPSFADTVLKLNFYDFEAYLQALNGKQRETIRRNQRRFKKAGLALRSIKPRQGLGRELFTCYNSIYSSAQIKWIHQTLKFFENLDKLGPTVRLTLALSKNETVAGFLLSYFDGKSWQGSRIGVHPDFRRKDAVYFNLLYSSIQNAISEKAYELSLGPTGYFVKSQLGAGKKTLNNLVLGLNPFWQAVLSSKRLQQFYVNSLNPLT